MKTVTAILMCFPCISLLACNKDVDANPIQNNGSTNNNPSNTKMKITIGTAVFTATMYDNPSANAFKEIFAITINMMELNNNEKYYDLPDNLPTNASVGDDIKVGDLKLYRSNTLVFFYKKFNTSYSYTKLGYIDNPAGLANALGNGNVIVKFENN